MESPRFLRKIVCAIALLCATVGLQAQSVKYIEALKNYQQGEMAEALRLFQEEVRENPANDAAYYYIAAIYSQDENRFTLIRSKYRSVFFGKSAVSCSSIGTASSERSVCR